MVYRALETLMAPQSNIVKERSDPHSPSLPVVFPPHTRHGYIQESAYFDSRFMISLSFSRETALTSVHLTPVHTLLPPQRAAEGEPILKAGCYPHLYPITPQPECLNTTTSKPRQPWCQLVPLNKSSAVVSRFPGLMVSGIFGSPQG